MNSKKIAVIVLAGVIVIIIVFIVARDNDKERGYVFDDTSGIKLEDVKTSLGSVDFDSGNLEEYFSKNVVNPYTLKFFKSIEKRFKDSKDFDDHFESVRQYLYSVLPPEEAEELMALYKKYMKYQQSLAELTKKWGSPNSPQDAIAYLHRLQEYRRNFFGKEVADALFGASVKAQEYPIRRGVIVNDKDMYGAEKEKKLRELNRDMWGKEANSVEEYSKPYTRYREKLKIYEKDLAEMGSDAERQKKIREFRGDLFSPEVVKRLEEVDQYVAGERAREDDYYTREEKIRNNPNYDIDEKAEKIKELQNEIFGDEADAFRRRINIEKGLEDIKNK